MRPCLTLPVPRAPACFIGVSQSLHYLTASLNYRNCPASRHSQVWCGGGKLAVLLPHVPELLLAAVPVFATGTGTIRAFQSILTMS